ncbi:MAG: NUDIX domain-containing protein [Clostridia bacterium]|nr:NUDIX domain-containing protein [Clostridia bacterium]
MSVRNSAKAIVLHDGKILVNRCVSRFGEYYALPGGGQHTGEMLSETVRRELLEETGYSVVPLRLSGIYERISEGRRDGNSHKIYFIFLCRLASEERLTPTETDRFQIGCDWIDLHTVHRCNLFPRAIRDNISGLIGHGETIFIGSEKDR